MPFDTCKSFKVCRKASGSFVVRGNPESSSPHMCKLLVLLFFKCESFLSNGGGELYSVELARPTQLCTICKLYRYIYVCIHHIHANLVNYILTKSFFLQSPSKWKCDRIICMLTGSIQSLKRKSG